MNVADLTREELIIRLGYNMGIICNYRFLLKESVGILAQDSKFSQNILAALLDAKEDYQEFIKKEALDME